MSSSDPKGGDDQIQSGGDFGYDDPEEVARTLSLVSANPPREPDPWEFPQTDLGNAELLKLRFGQHLRWCKAQKEWWVWDGRRWSEDSKNSALAMANKIARERKSRSRDIWDAKKKKYEFQWALSSEAASRRDACLTQAKSFPDMCLDLNDLDDEPWLLNCQNGILDLRSLAMVEHDPGKMQSKISGASYDASAVCPIWEAYLHRVCGEKSDLVNFLQRAVGYSLTGSMRESALFVLYGEGANGKSLFLKILTSILGDYATIAASDALIAKQRVSGPNPEIAMLRGARFVSASETASGARMDEAMVKQMTGGDPVTARFLNANFVTFQPQCKIWLATNYKPEIRGSDHGIWRRLKLVPFTVSIPKEEQDAELPDKLRKEWPGILAWAVRGCQLWQESGLAEPAEVQQATQAYRSEMDAIQAFLDSYCVKVPYSRVKSSRLYALYQQWCKDTGEYALSLTKFGLRLAQKGIKKQKLEDGLHYIDLMLATDQVRDIIGDFV